MNNLYFLCPDDNHPIGGIKVLYRHVDILNRSRFQAAIVHTQKGFRCTWFENQTRVQYRQNLQPDPFDFAVIPEIYGLRATEFFPQAKRVIFCQGCYLTFKGYSLDPDDLRTPYLHPRTVAAMVVSEDSRQYLAHVFPSLRVERIHNSINPKVFRFRELAAKKLRISFMQQRYRDDAVQVVNILKFRGRLDGVEVVSIHDKTETEAAEILGDTLIFLSLGYQEGFGYPPVEAMACGCLTVGYHGHGGREYFRPEFSWPIDIGNVIQFSKTLEEILQTFREKPHALQQKATAACEFVLQEYSAAREERDVLQFWDKLMFEQGHDAIAEA